jgi:hypothetical protein
MAGGVLSDYVLCNFPNGTSWNFVSSNRAKGASGAGGQQVLDLNVQAEETLAAQKKKTGSNKSPMAYVKEDIAKFFDIPRPTPAEVAKAMTRTKEIRINGEPHKIKSMATNMGSTGKSRSVTVKFKSLQNIGGKQVASVKIAMPASYTVGDMIRFLMESRKSNLIAAIVSPKGKAVTYGNAYKRNKKRGNQRALPAGR